MGAVLTQNTSWKNVERAISNLRQAGVLSLEALAAIRERELARLLHPSGFFNVKSRRLKALCHWLVVHQGLDQLDRHDTGWLRQSLLAVNGIGPETADDILLYAFNRPVFVIDAYTRRLLANLGLIEGNERYEVLRQYFETALEPDSALYNEYHALIVRHAKEKCSRTSQCLHCQVEAPVIF